MSEATFQLLGEIADTNSESLPGTTNPNTKLRYIDLSAVTSGCIDWNKVEEVTYSTAPSRARRIVKAGDVLFGTVRPNLQSHGFIDKPYWENLVASTGFSVIHARETMSDPNYLFHCVMSNFVKAQAESKSVGSNYPAVNDCEVRRFLVFAPKLIEQRKIAQILDTLDTTIHQTEAIIAKLQQVKQGLLHDLLTRGIDANGELRPPVEVAPHLFKESPLGWIPKEWEVMSGRDVCDEIVVGIVIRPTQYYRATGIPVLRSANVKEEGLSLSDLVYMSHRDHMTLQKSAVTAGDVLTVRTGYPGTSCVVDDQVDGANCVDIIISRPSKKLLPQYWAEWINSPYGKDQILKVQGGLAQQHFNVGELSLMLVHLPTIAEQEQITDRMASIKKQILKELDCFANLRKVKSGLMDDLLTGRVRVTPLLNT
jgi:type I restriction enzyme S subunit